MKLSLIIVTIILVAVMYIATHVHRSGRIEFMTVDAGNTSNDNLQH